MNFAKTWPVILFILMQVPAAFAVPKSKDIPVPVPLTLRCQILFSRALPNHYDPVKSALRKLNLLLIQIVNQAKRSPHHNTAPLVDAQWAREFNTNALLNGEVVLTYGDREARIDATLKFIRGVESELAALNDEDRIRLLQALFAAPPELNRKGLHPFARDFDGVWDYFARRNEWTNFLNGVELWSMDWLVQIGSARSLEALEVALLHSHEGPQVELIRKALSDPTLHEDIRAEARNSIIDFLSERRLRSQDALLIYESTENVYRRIGEIFPPAAKVRSIILNIERNLDWLGG